MIVVDTNVLVYLWLPGDYTEQAEILLETKLITHDQKILKCFPDLAIDIKKFV